MKDVVRRYRVLTEYGKITIIEWPTKIVVVIIVIVFILVLYIMLLINGADMPELLKLIPKLIPKLIV